MKSGSVILLEPSGPVQACNGIALPFCMASYPSRQTSDMPVTKMQIQQINQPALQPTLIKWNVILQDKDRTQNGPQCWHATCYLKRFVSVPDQVSYSICQVKKRVIENEYKYLNSSLCCTSLYGTYQLNKQTERQNTTQFSSSCLILNLRRFGLRGHHQVLQNFLNP